MPDCPPPPFLSVISKENEGAMTDSPWVSLWITNGWVNMNGKKMNITQFSRLEILVISVVSLK